METLNSRNNKNPLNKLAFWPAMACLAIFIAFGVFRQEQLGALLNKMLYGMADTAGWYFELLAFFTLIFTVILVFSKWGSVRIGGPDAKPDFKYWNWITMSLCGGIGTGLLFWAMGEPIYHFSGPPVSAGVEAFSRDAAVFSISQTMWQWSIPEYCMYTICAVGFALCTYNLKKPLAFGPLLDMAFRKKSRKLETIVHGITIFTMCGAVACSMGVGLMQIGAGLQSLFGFGQTKVLWFLVAAAITILFTLSCISGLGNGLKKLSSFTTIVFIGILIYVLVLGPTEFIAKLGTESFANMIVEWPERTMMLNALAPDDKWFADWTVQYWASFIVYAPILGMFLSRLAKGRTIREFVLVNVLAPSTFCIVWIATFGGMTINLQTSGSFDVLAAVNETGMQSAIFYILGQFPMGGLLIAAFVLCIFTSFATMADPVAAALATISIRDLSVEDEAPRKIKILIGIIMGVVAYLLVASGGVGSVKGMWVIVGLPVSFIMIISVVAGFRGAVFCHSKSDHLGDFDEMMKKQ